MYFYNESLNLFYNVLINRELQWIIHIHCTLYIMNLFFLYKLINMIHNLIGYMILMYSIYFMYNKILFFNANI